MNSSWDETRDGGLLNQGCWTGGCCTNALSVPIKWCVSLTGNLVSVVCFFFKELNAEKLYATCTELAALQVQVFFTGQSSTSCQPETASHLRLDFVFNPCFWKGLGEKETDCPSTAPFLSPPQKVPELQGICSLSRAAPQQSAAVQGKHIRQHQNTAGLVMQIPKQAGTAP